MGWLIGASRKTAEQKGWLIKASQLWQSVKLGPSICLTACVSGLASQRMSRIRNTLDTLSKAFSGPASAQLASKIARLKPGSVRTEKAVLKMECSAAEASPGPLTPPAQKRLQGESMQWHGETTTQAQQSSVQDQQSAVQAQQTAEASLSTPVAEAPTGSAPVTKATSTLFPSAFSANLNETYDSLSQQVSAYFGSDSTGDAKRPRRQEDTTSTPAPSQERWSFADRHLVLAPVAEKGSNEAPPPGPDQAAVGSTRPAAGSPVPHVSMSTKKGLGRYLSYPGPTVQAFVGSYIAPLVPKFRRDSKGAVAEESPSPSGEKSISKAGMGSEGEEKSAAEKAKLLQSQREKIRAMAGVDNRTRGLVRALQTGTDVRRHTSRVEELSLHLGEFPETRGVAVKEKVIPCLLRLRQAGDSALQAAVRVALSLVGYTDPVRGRGIRVLSIDGGGTRGLVALQTLHRLQNLTGRPIHQLFDYICGVSTGSILAFMLAVFQIPLEECEQLYRKLGQDVFKQNVIVGTVKMGWSHAFYDSQVWEGILRDRMGSVHMIDTARNPKCPKVAAVSTIVNRGLPLKAYVFRNYTLPLGVRSHYLGGCQHELWQAVRASSAAPGYFQEFVLGNDLHQDGGLLINNPTALAIHECKSLWPNTPIQCVVSLGTGRYESLALSSVSQTSLKAKITNVISSATDTEEVHSMLDALLPPDTYFRFNPYMTEDIALDESRREKLNFLQEEGRVYLERNENKLRKAAGVLVQEKSPIQRLAEWFKLKADMYEGLPFVSKL